jgi:intracellular multiplication protein IcmE
MAIALKLPLGGHLSGAGGAGPRRLVVIAAVTVGAIGLVLLVWSRTPNVEGPANLARAPKADALPGGRHSNPAYTDLATAHDKELAVRAAEVGQSSVASMPGSETATRVPPPAAPLDPPKAREAGVSSPPAATVAAPALPRAMALPVAASPPVMASQPTKPDENQTKMYQAAISSLLAGWGGKAQATDVILRPEDGKATNDGPTNRGAVAMSDGVQTAAAVQPIANARRIGGRASGQVLMPAGRGIYARTVLAASSDQGGPVVIEALSGPIAGDRMTGTFEKRDERLVVKLTSITLQDGTQQRIDALVIAPDSMETSVASSVDEHYVSRFMLPVAAAFVSGLGQAISQSNSTVVASPLGGATAFQRLNLGQELGVGAGVAGAQFGTILKDAAPKGPTVKLDANVSVGVVFLAPLVVGEN